MGRRVRTWTDPRPAKTTLTELHMIYENNGWSKRSFGEYFRLIILVYLVFTKNVKVNIPTKAR